MTTSTTTTGQVADIDPLQIDLDPTQPRQEIDPEPLDELAASVREQGVITPLIVVAKDDGRYQLLVGERRYRAALAAELAAVPCIVQERIPTWTEALDIQLTENLHRVDLRPLEVAQTLWRRILGANIEALEAEQDDDGAATGALLANYLTPAAQIAALEDRLCALAGVASVADYFGGGRVRVPRKPILARYGMAGWSESRLKKLFSTLDVDPVVQDLLAGADVSARTLRDLGKLDPATQAAVVAEAQAAAASGQADVGTQLRQEVDKRNGKKTAEDKRKKAEKGKGKSAGAPVQAALPEDDADESPHAGAEGSASEIVPLAPAGDSTFTPDPQLAFLTSSGGHAPRLVTDQVEPQWGSAPPVSKAGAWDDDQVLQLESALEAAQTLCTDAGVLRLTDRQIARLAPRWRQLVADLRRAGLELEV